MERTEFMNVVRATEKNFRINYSISGYYRLMLDGEPIKVSNNKTKREIKMTREEIEKLAELEPYCFETDKEEQWYKIGLKEGLETADNNPKWISVNDSLPCDFENLLENEILTVKVLVVLQWNEDPNCKHIEICDMCNKIGSFTVDWFWRCSGYYTVTHWMPLPNFPKE